MTWVNSLEHVLFPFAIDGSTTTRKLRYLARPPWAVATARRPWAGLTVCVYMAYMDVHASGSRSLPCAATLSSTY